VTIFPCRLDDEAASVGIEPTGLVAGNRHLAYVDMDGVRFDGPEIVMDFADGSTATLAQLGRTHDEFVLAFGEARRRARRAALLQWTGDQAIDEYDGRRGDSMVIVGEPGDDPLLGATTLEAFGLVLDPFRRELRPMALPLKAACRDRRSLAFQALAR